MGCCSPDREVAVEVKRLVMGGQTCERCGDAWDAALAAVRAVEGELAGYGVRVRLIETQLPPERITESNTVLVAGRPAEEWLDGAVLPSDSDCPSCGELVGEPVCCRSYEVAGEEVEALTPEVIATAIRRAAGIPEPRPIGALRVTIVTTPECG
ncbi:MAG: DUF2703 domain-containing protein [Anaerosomatales bacterium]|nr:DUF2703 domain-containing protein [Anaerosomatales bacterium]